MDNKELAKELLGYTYIDIQNIPELYNLLGINLTDFKRLFESEEYEDALYTLLDSRASNVVMRILMNPLNRLKKSLAK